MDVRSERRRRAQEELGLTSTQEQQEIERSIEKEERRRAKKEAKRMRIENTSSYRWSVGIAKYMDQYFLDPIIGLFLPGIGDILTSTLAMPFIYVSLFVVRSVPLTLAVIFNTLVDVLLGMIPFLIGDLIDAFHRSYKKNLRLIDGFVNDDQTVINEVNRKAIWMAILIAVCCYLIYLLYQLVEKLILWIGDLLNTIIS